MNLASIVATLQLVPHPEGGYFRETYRQVGEDGLPAATAIYYLLTPDSFSEMHRLRHDEIFHFYLGGPVEMLQLHADGTNRILRLGLDFAQGERPQVLVGAGVWQGSRLIGGEFALLGTTMTPGFRFEDYEQGKLVDLVKLYPDCADRLKLLCRV